MGQGRCSVKYIGIEIRPMSIIRGFKKMALDSAQRGNPFSVVCRTFEKAFAWHSRGNDFFCQRNPVQSGVDRRCKWGQTPYTVTELQD